MDKQDFFDRMGDLKAAFPSSGPDLGNPRAMKLYYEKLKILDSRAWSNAIDLCLSDCEFFPSIARLLRYGATTSSMDFAQLAEQIATEVRGLVGLIGARNVERAESRVPKEAWTIIERLGGWKRWVESMETEKDLNWSIKDLQKSLENEMQGRKDDLIINGSGRLSDSSAPLLN